MSNCNCPWINNASYNPGKCTKVVSNYICLVCGAIPSFWMKHGDDGDYSGAILSCPNCLIFTILFDDFECKSLYKKEFYISNNMGIELENNIFTIYNINGGDGGNEKVFSIPYFEFVNWEHFLKKLKTYIMFS